MIVALFIPAHQMWCRARSSSIVFDMPDGYFGIGCYFETEG